MLSTTGRAPFASPRTRDGRRSPSRPPTPTADTPTVRTPVAITFTSISLLGLFHDCHVCLVQVVRDREDSEDGGQRIGQLGEVQGMGRLPALSESGQIGCVDTMVRSQHLGDGYHEAAGDAYAMHQNDRERLSGSEVNA